MATGLPTPAVTGSMSRLRLRSTGYPHREPLRDAYVLAGIVFVLVILTGNAPWLGVDARSYWLERLPNPYPPAYGGTIGFNYSPVVAQLVAPLTLLPWPAFLALVTAGNLLALYLLVGRWAVLAILLPPVAIELFAGNVNLWLAVALAYALRWPALWAVPILTKVAPGIGVLWHLFRGEWRALAIVGGTTAAIVAVSAVIAPDAWGYWFTFLRANAGMAAPVDAVALPFLPRLAAAVVVMAVAARTDRAWLIPVATVLATPVIWPATFCLLLAIPRLRRPDPVRPDVERAGVDVGPAAEDHGPEPRVGVSHV